MIKINTKSTYALSVQKKVGTFDFPFTLNPYIGCEMGCVYCFVPQIVIKKSREDFFHNVEIKSNFPELLLKDLKKYSGLPQHLKRVQIGVTTELFQPKVINYCKKELGFDPIERILDIFLQQDKIGNHWMLNILTKNHNVASYIDKLKSMKHMVQIEMSMIHNKESKSREFETFTSSIKRRLNAIKQLSAAGIFVRVMAMPFAGSRQELDDLKNLVFSNGAKAFKNKSLNYYDWDSFNNSTLHDQLSRKKGKTNDFIPELIIKSGEEVIPMQNVNVRLPRKRNRGEKFINWAIHPNEGLEEVEVNRVDMGYSSISKLNWGYIQ